MIYLNFLLSLFIKEENSGNLSLYFTRSMRGTAGFDHLHHPLHLHLFWWHIPVILIQALISAVKFFEHCFEQVKEQPDNSGWLSMSLWFLLSWVWYLLNCFFCCGFRVKLSSTLTTKSEIASFTWLSTSSVFYLFLKVFTILRAILYDISDISSIFMLSSDISAASESL